ncbi:hypothetical protein [Methylomonas sp. CM2]|uniref:hypothetical protein n=1 Tax=Methylomonas sp. CM2 TaxID=3417647 RepID=UPI003CE8F182
MKDKYIEDLTKKIDYNSFLIRCLYFDISVIFAEQGLLYSEHDVYNVSRNGLSSFFNAEYLSLLDKVSSLIDHNIFLKDTLDFVNKMSDDHDHRLFVIYAFAFFLMMSVVLQINLAVIIFSFLSI